MYIKRFLKSFPRVTPQKFILMRVKYLFFLFIIENGQREENECIFRILILF